MIVAAMLMALACWSGCKGGSEPQEEVPVQELTVIKGDSMLYGLTCPGTTDSVVVLWPFGGEPQTYSCIDAKQAGRIIGQPKTGDWIGIMLNPEDTTEVTMVINLDQLKGTWTYPVMPVVKELEHMSKKMQKRMLASMPDSVVRAYLVPREYGFALKRNHVARPATTIHHDEYQEANSPVKYPDVKNYKEWHMLNSNLILVSGELLLPGAKPSQGKPDVLDTLQVEYLDDDSLILRQNGTRYGFKRNKQSETLNL